MDSLVRSLTNQDGRRGRNNNGADGDAICHFGRVRTCDLPDIRCLTIARRHRNQRKKKALADTKSQFAKVTEENKTLLKQLEDTQRENYEVTEFLRQELLQKTEKIVQMEQEMVKVRATRTHPCQSCVCPPMCHGGTPLLTSHATCALRCGSRRRST